MGRLGVVAAEKMLWLDYHLREFLVALTEFLVTSKDELVRTELATVTFFLFMFAFFS